MENIEFKSGEKLTGRVVMVLSHSIMLLSSGRMFLVNRHKVVGKYEYNEGGRC